MDELLGRLLWAQLRTAGWCGDDVTDISEVTARHNAPQHVARWFAASIDRLREQGLVRRSGDLCVALDAEPPAEAWAAWERRRDELLADASTRPRLVIAEAMLRTLPQLLAGEKLTTDVLFPGGSMELVRPVYRGNPMADFLNEIVAEAVGGYVHHRRAEDPSARVRLLEIGAGTGSTSQDVLRTLADVRDAVEEYRFTDLSRAFLQQAEAAFHADAPYLRTAVLDIERPPAEQGADTASYDVVLATNVLHATRRVREAVAHAKSLLRPGGLLVLNEMNDSSMLSHVAFGLLEGWWLHEDPELRMPASPALTSASWERVLSEAGFRSVFFPVAEVPGVEGQIVIAQSDGILPGATAPGPAAAAPAVEQAALARAAEPVASHRAALLTELAGALQMPETSIAGDRAFRDYGLDSILGIQFVQRVNTVLGTELATTVLFEHGTLDQLAAFVDSSGLVAPARLQAPMQVPAPVAAATVAPVETTDDALEPIAIVGLSGRFAGSRTPEELWEHLAAGTDLVGDVTRWDLSHLKRRNPDFCTRGAFLDGHDEFDPLFFGVSGLEAEFMDPQQRVFLEESWTALENAGYAGAGVRGSRCGVYAGFTGGDYHSLYRTEESFPQAMMGQAGSILSARIAYMLDLRGPAVTVDTACSSSLVAVHLACEALRSGGLDMALAGGVFVLSTPEFFASAQAAGMLSASGRCAAFDAGADGFVPGEGAGVVVLRRLRDALADGDFVHGVIRGSGVNQDGASNGITAPRVGAQEALLGEVWDRFGVDAGSIGLVEAHGTGTALGDPVEFEALSRAFGARSDGRGFCALGTVKANLGHTAAAAGVAGVVKAVLALRHGKVPPLVHFERVNPRIALEGSPFYVNGGLREWVPGVGGSRLAAVSAFGFSGTNAHVVIEQAPQRLRVARVVPGCLVVLSAASVEQVREQAGALLGWADSAVGRDTPLADVSFTLLTGRRHVRHRLAVVVSDRAGLVAALSGWLENGAAPGVFVSETSQPAQHPAGLVRYAQECLRECGAPSGLDGAAYRERLSAVAELFVQGQDFDFGVLFAEGGFARVPLPTYPFARRRYWPAKAERRPSAGGREELHPLVHANTSMLGTTRFTTTLTGEEFFLADHVVGGRSLLPGVVSLEMARAAVCLALDEGEQSLRLRNVTWPRPVISDGTPVTLRITLSDTPSGAIGFAIHGEDAVVHCQGEAERLTLPAPATDPAPPAGRRITAEENYAALRARGIEHGPRLRALTDVHLGADRAVSRLLAPSDVASGDYWLHPSLLDAALQTVVAFSAGTGASASAVPFAADEVAVFGPCPEHPVAIARATGASAFDVDVCAEDGTVCVRIQGLHLRELDRQATAPALPSPSAADRDGADGGVFLVPTWTPVPTKELRAADPAPAGTVLVVGEDGPYRRRVLAALPEAVAADSAATAGRDGLAQVLWVAPEPAGAPAEEQDRGVLEVLRLVKSLLAAGYGERELWLTVATVATQAVTPDEPNEPAHASVHGLVGALAKEYPHWQVRLVDLPASGPWPVRDLLTLPAVDATLAYRSGCWYAQRWLPAAVPVGVGGVRRGGVYVVVGGAGGIGVVWSEYVARVYGAQVVWLGRRPVDAVIGAGVERVAAVGPRPVYVVADVTDAAAVERAAVVVRERFGAVHGVVHSGLVLADRSLASMSEGEFRAALDVKVAGSVHLVEAFGGPSLELVLFFSSLNAFLRAAGQSNYAAGCTFQDAFAARLAVELPGRVRVVHWGYWGSVGAVSTPAQRERMRRLGLVSIEAPEAMAAVEAVVAGPRVHTGFLNTNGSVDVAGITIAPVPVGDLKPLPALARIVQADLEERFASAAVPVDLPSAGAAGLDVAEVLGLVSEVLGVEGEAIDAQAPLEEYGWDRVRLAAFVERLRGRGIEADERSLLTAHTLAELIQETRESTGGVDALIADLLWDRLSATGWFTAPVDDVCALAHGHLGRWLDETLRLLDARGHVRYDGMSCTPLRPAPQSAWSEWDRTKETVLAGPDFRTQVVLIDTVLKALPDVLTGRRLATEILFPDSSMDLVQGLYQGNRLADFFNGVLADAVAVYVERRLAEDPAARVRILEVGAGTGGTSAMVFRRLRPYRDAIAEYRYTDLSPAFLQHAERAYGPDNPFLVYGLLDIERSPADQDVELGTYDLVVATNVLHATRRMHRTLAHAKALLRPNGLLLVNELTRNEVWVHLTFGLLEGWWLSEDAELRIPGGPVLAPATWRRALGDVGFRTVAFPLGADRDLPHHVIMAESDGVISLVSEPRPRAVEPMAEAAVVQEPPVEEPSVEDRAAVRERGVELLRTLFAETLKVEIADLDPHASFESFGIDSIVVVQLTARLRQVFGEVGSTLLFEHRTLASLAEHFGRTHPDVLTAGARNAAPSAPETAAKVMPAPVRREEREEDVAIVGLAGRYPGADALDAFWANLRAGHDSVTEVPADRWAATAGRDWHGGFLSGVDRFDPLFFGISPVDAELMDPQERLFLECSYATLQDAGYTRDALNAQGRVGVYVGVMYSEYQLYGAQEQLAGEPVAMAGSAASIANRVSYFADFTGPSLAVDTMCSASLTAIHLACESIRRGESDLALAGGVNVSVHPNKFLMLGQGGFLSEAGRCAAFGAQGDGFVPAEGVGAVLLKPLSRAVADGDRIHGVIKGSAVNHGGRTNGYTVPDPAAQRAVIAEALTRAGIDPATVSYVEAHGTGTSLGDPIEIAGLAGALGDRAGQAHPVAIGSVKSNIGHAESAAGIAGLTKVLLQMRHGELVPTLHTHALNPHIDFAGTPFQVQREVGPWRTDGTPRRAGISSFGAGGANAHVIVEEYTPPPVRRYPAPGLVVLSAKDEDRLRAAAGELAAFLDTAEVDLTELVHSLQTGREAMTERLAFWTDTVAGARDRLRAFAERRTGEWHRGRAGREPGTVAAGTWLDQGAYDRVLEAWTRGHAVDWSRLYRAGSPRRIALPTYPFARERCWIAQSPTPGARPLHPLLHRNTSDLTEVRYSSTFTGREPFLSPAPDGGARRFPGVALLELARAALELADGRRAVAVREVRWPERMPCLDTPFDLNLALNAAATGEFRFEAFGTGEDPVLYGTGRLIPATDTADAQNFAAVDLDALRARCPRTEPSGPGYPGARALHVGTDTVLVELAPDAEAVTALDMAVRAAAFLGTPQHPETLEELRVQGEGPAAWAVVRSRASLLDVELRTADGAPVLTLTGLALAAGAEPQPGTTAPRPVAPAPGRRPGLRGMTLEQSVTRDIKEIIGRLLRIAPDRLDADANFADFGFDSIRLPQFAKQLTVHFGVEITPAVFFGHPTPAHLTRYCLAEHGALIRAFYGEPDAASAAPAAPAEPAPRVRRSSLRASASPRVADAVAAAGAARPADEPIAVIGISGRFPGARDTGELWRILSEGRDVVTAPDPDRFTGPWQGGWAPGVYEFDPLFFGISPREAEMMDPRQRLLLQEAWRALEDAGQGDSRLNAGQVGMFVGVEGGDYHLTIGAETTITAQHEGVLAARLAYFLDLDGPNMAINTACSSGLVATHQACQSLRSGECDTAVAAGVTLLLHPDTIAGMAGAGMLSADGRCFAFDQRANGMVPAEAVAVVVLKRLSQAVADGDPVHAVIRGSGINYDGRTNGIAAPSGVAQAKLVRQVHDRFGIGADEVTHVVAHGTGTRLGDPIEVNALGDAFRGRSERTGYCALTSTKSNLGHSFAASGVVSLISLVLALRHRTIPASLHVEEQNEFIDWADSPFYVNRATRAWETADGAPLTGAVSAFGLSGTNAHLVVSEYRAETVPAAPAPYHLLLVSARTEAALRERIEDLVRVLGEETADLGSVAYTLMDGRRHFDHRVAVIAADRAHALDLLRGAAAGERSPVVVRGAVPRGFEGAHAIRSYGEELITRRRDPLETLQALADLYCQGYTLPWGGLYDVPPRRVSLPGYPFARETYRLGGPVCARPAPAAAPAAEPVATEPPATEATGTTRPSGSSMTGLRRRLLAGPAAPTTVTAGAGSAGVSAKSKER
ncbi:SDR family NAD(P)-dependent oxidoreductase [Streptomyces sp. NBC_01235]|uniref:SDR family NAD(P)-dependent oxidoreductase n=1 Tax=Streptomyces sp. NBC_01235 TaxID=2903788 RepID=UPI002E157ADE|nr:SDR family NAD(P)-dependent oxidoreductase [Streptomyces sp. NBC_01235]